MNRLKMLPFIAVCLFTACFVYAQDTQQQPKPMLESEIAPDLAFDHYVDLDLIGKAVYAGDADLLTDTALQLATAERTLMRPHKSGITSQALLIVSINLAKENRDHGVLERLAKIAESLNNKDLADKVVAAQKLAAGPVDIFPDLMVSVKEMSPEEYAAFHQCLFAIQIAKLTGDATWLQDWETKYGFQQSDNSRHYIYLRDLVAKTLVDLPKVELVSRSVLSKLAEESRGEVGGGPRHRPDDKHKPDDRNKPGHWDKPDDRNKPGHWNRPDHRNIPDHWNRPGHWYTCPFCRGLKVTHAICPTCHGTGRSQRHFGWWNRWRSHSCSTCGGDGRIDIPCRHCNGTGRMMRR